MPNHDLSKWQEEREDALLVEQPKLTACKDCRHFMDTGSMATDKKCGASPLVLFYPLKGERQEFGFHTVFEINKGDCPKFQEKEN